MLTEEITIRVDPAVAKAYNSALDEDKLKMEWLANFQFEEFLRRDRSLIEVMDEIGRKAKARGLTPEILESFLNEPR